MGMACIHEGLRMIKRHVPSRSSIKSHMQVRGGASGVTAGDGKKWRCRRMPSQLQYIPFARYGNWPLKVVSLPGRVRISFKSMYRLYYLF